MEKNIINYKYKKYQRLILFMINFIIWAVLLGTFILTWLNFYHSRLPAALKFFRKGHYLIFALYGIILLAFTHFYGGYRVGYYRKTDVFLSASLSLIFTNIIMFFQISLMAMKIVEIIPILVLTAVDILLLLIWSYIANHIYFMIYPPHQILMIYEGKSLSQDLVYKMSERAEKYNIVKAISVDFGIDEIFKEILSFETVLISDVKSPQRNVILKYCYKNNIRIYITPKISDIIIRGAKEITLFDTPILMTDAFGLTIEQRILKRGFDIILSVIGIIVSSLFMILTAIAIKIEDNGPVFYKQNRLTIDGKVFPIYKFRSMVIDAEKDNGVQLAEQGDGRITKVGSFIRKTRIDELPQFFNIFKGDMSFVGPRPERPEIAKEYEKNMEEFSYRLKVKAGLTGYAQVVGKYNTTPYDKLKMDLMYISNYTFLEDIKLILITIKILFIKESTQGIIEGQKTAKKTED